MLKAYSDTMLKLWPNFVPSLKYFQETGPFVIYAASLIHQMCAQTE